MFRLQRSSGPEYKFMYNMFTCKTTILQLIAITVDTTLVQNLVKTSRNRLFLNITVSKYWCHSKTTSKQSNRHTPTASTDQFSHQYYVPRNADIFTATYTDVRNKCNNLQNMQTELSLLSRFFKT